MNKKLKKLLEDKNITQKQLAEAAGVTQPFMSNVLKGYKIPSANVLKRMADYLGVTIDYLLEEE